MATLYQIRGDGSRGERWEINDGPMVVGRGRLANVMVEDEGLSRRHFVILREGEDCLIQDLNSRNGTWVDGERIVAAKLHHSDSILAGRTTFLFLDHAVSSATARNALKGPHGTQMLFPTPMPKRDSPTCAAWPEDALEPCLAQRQN